MARTETADFELFALWGGARECQFGVSRSACVAADFVSLVAGVACVGGGLWLWAAGRGGCLVGWFGVVVLGRQQAGLSVGWGVDLAVVCVQVKVAGLAQ